MSELPDSNLNRTAKRVVRVDTSFLADLASEVLTAPFLEEIITLTTKLDGDRDTMEVTLED